MSRLLPFPRTSVALFLAWLLLHPGPGALTVLGGLVLAVWLPRLWAPLRLARGRAPMRPRLLLRLAGRVVADIVRSNLAVAGLILSGRDYSPGFVHIPLELREPRALAVLSGIITATPGTIWVSHDSRACELVIHVLDLDDPDAWIASIKGQYESLLLEIFA